MQSLTYYNMCSRSSTRLRSVAEIWYLLGQVVDRGSQGQALDQEWTSWQEPRSLWRWCYLQLRNKMARHGNLEKLQGTYKSAHFRWACEENAAYRSISYNWVYSACALYVHRGYDMSLSFLFLFIGERRVPVNCWNIGPFCMSPY
jgi:hypothetical protein